MAQSVECHFLPATQDAPNSRNPAIHYKDVLPSPLGEETSKMFLTVNQWEHRGTWGHIPIRHFHPNSHECYGIFSGSSTVLLGQLRDGKGVEVSVKAGDVLLLPAGMAHSMQQSTADFRYIGVYPKDAPRWVNEYGKRPAEAFRETINNVEMPRADPVFGPDGPVMRIWNCPRQHKL